MVLPTKTNVKLEQNYYFLHMFQVSLSETVRTALGWRLMPVWTTPFRFSRAFKFTLPVWKISASNNFRWCVRVFPWCGHEELVVRFTYCKRYWLITYANSVLLEWVNFEHFSAFLGIKCLKQTIIYQLLAMSLAWWIPWHDYVNGSRISNSEQKRLYLSI